MRPRVYIHPEPHVVKDDVVEVAARIEWARRPWRLRADASQRVWFRLPADLADDVPRDATPFVLAALFRCMKIGRPVEVHGSVAPGLLENLERFQRNWERWMPAKYRAVPILAEGSSEPRHDRAGAVLAYSGGIDSTYAVHRCLTDDGGAPDLRAGVMVHGFDIPIDESEGFQRAAERSRRILDSRDVPLLLASTNLRDIRQSWEDANRAGIAAVLHLLRGRYATGLSANSYQVDFARRLFPEDVEDQPLTGSSDFPVGICGAEPDRIGRLEGLLDWPEALADLRVCYADERYDRNCGRCGKCIIVMLAARILGVGPLPCFDRDVEDAEIVHMLKDPHQIIPVRAQQLLEAARRRKLDESWMAVAEEVRGEDPLRRIRREALAVGRPYTAEL